MLILALDTATPAASVALVRNGDPLGERASRAVRVLADADALLREAGLRPADLGALVGYLIVSRYVDAWHVMNVAVDPEQRGRGVGTMLLERLFELTADDARRGYTLEVRVSNVKAIDLYERLGFRSRGLRRGYYTDNREDALIMWKDPVANGSA